MTVTPVVILRGAESDLRELRRYIRQRFGAAVWDESRVALRKAFVRLASHPCAGHLPDELAALNLVQYRQVMVGMNRIIYELRDRTVYVHVVCDTRRDLRAVLLRRLLGASSF